MCDRCNPLGLVQPAASQAHGTILLAVGGAILALALLGRFALGGTGPFRGEIVGVTRGSSGLVVALSLTNLGSSSGSTTCRISDPASAGIAPDASYVVSPPVEAGRTVAFSATVATLGNAVRPLAVDCSGR